MKRARLKCPKNEKAYRQLWRVVDGAVLDALDSHPDYLTAKGAKSARLSITKRVTGAVIGFAEQSARAGRVDNPAAETGEALIRVSPCGALLTHRKASLLRRWGRLFSWSV